MKNISKYHRFLLAGLLIGFTAGAITGHIIDVTAKGSPMINITPAAPSNGQQNLLFIGVDHLNSKSPQLKSIWLVLLFPDNPRIALIPIFPYTNDDSTVHNKSLVESFKLTKDGNLARTFLEELKTLNFWWTDTIIADRTALVEISRIALDGNHLASTKISRSIIKPIDKLENNSSSHNQGLINKITALCQLVDSKKIENHLPVIFKLFASHIRTNIKPQEITNQLDRRKSIQGGLICEFPTLHP
jgi:hypothetical protein